MLEHVRGMSVMQARATLQFSPRARRARRSSRVLRSATANAEENHDLDPDELRDRPGLRRRGPRRSSAASRAHAVAPCASTSARATSRSCCGTSPSLARGSRAAKATIAAEPPPRATRRRRRSAPRRPARPRRPRPPSRPTSRRRRRGRRGGAQAEADGAAQGPPPRHRGGRRGAESPKTPSPQPRRQPPAAEADAPAAEAASETSQRRRRRRSRWVRRSTPAASASGSSTTGSPNWFSEKEFGAYLIEDVRIRDHIRGKLVARRALGHPHPQGLAADHDRHLHGASRHRDRQVRQRGRRAAPGRARHDAQGRADQHQRDQAARAGRQPGRAVGRRAAAEPRVVPARHEALAGLGRCARARRASSIQCGGRLGGAEMSRTEQYSEGRVPLHTLRADIDYGFAEAKTTFGRIGVKVWINKGEIMPEGYEGRAGQTTRLGEVDARRRGGADGDRGPRPDAARPAAARRWRRWRRRRPRSRRRCRRRRRRSVRRRSRRRWPRSRRRRPGGRVRRRWRQIAPPARPRSRPAAGRVPQGRADRRGSAAPDAPPPTDARPRLRREGEA